MNKMLTGAFLIVVGLMVGTSGLSLAEVGFSNFDDEYPANQTWGQFGTLIDTQTSTEGYLELQDGNSSGEFLSDQFSEEGQIRIDTVTYDANLPRDSTNANMTIYLLNQNNAVVAEKSIEMQDGRYSVGLDNITENTGDAYYFDISLSDENPSDSSRPLVETVQVRGTDEVGQTSSGLATGMQWLLIFVGFFMVIRDVF